MASGIHAPGLKMNKKDCLQAAHNSLLAHGRSVQAIRAEARKTPVIGYAPAAWWLWSPVSDDPADIEACRKQTFCADEDQVGGSAWWMDPVFLGNVSGKCCKDSGRIYAPDWAGRYEADIVSPV